MAELHALAAGEQLDALVKFSENFALQFPENVSGETRKAVPEYFTALFLATGSIMKTKIRSFLITLLIICLEPLQNANAVNPPPDGGYPGGNTAEGDRALLNLTSGGYNTALGFRSLENNTEGNFNTAIGTGALLFNVMATENTATGAGALFADASLFLNGGNGNTANGAFALFRNSTGSLNTAIGDRALFNNSTGSFNTANGNSALSSNTTGASNTVIGNNALANNTTGSNNIALGDSAGSVVTTANNTICIGAAGANLNGCYIGQIFGATLSGGAAVFINANGRLGTTTSSRRFKEEIKPMERASEVVFALTPVTFRYKKEIDPDATPQFGLVAEDVAKVNPDLVVRDPDGKAFTVRYEAVNAMLLNEFLKEHKKTEKLEATLASLIATVKEQAAQIQKVSAQLEASKATPQVVNNP